MGSTASSSNSQTIQIMADFIKNNKIAVFSKSYCPYCDEAKRALSKLNVKYATMELDQVAGGSAIQAALKDLTGQRTVPNIFIQQRHVGGCDDTLAAINRGIFQKALQEDENSATKNGLDAFRVVKL